MLSFSGFSDFIVINGFANRWAHYIRFYFRVLFKAKASILCVCGRGGRCWTTYGVEDRAVLVLGVLSLLLSRDIAALCREVSRSPLEAIEHYCPYHLDEEMEVARCQAGGKTRWALLLALIVAAGQGGTCATAAFW